MKYAVKYWNPGEERDPRRTRFVSLSTAKDKRDGLEEYGHETQMIPKSEFPEPKPHSLRPSIMNKDVANHWKFIHTSDGSLICIKNGGQYPLHKLP